MTTSTQSPTDQDESQPKVQARIIKAVSLFLIVCAGVAVPLGHGEYALPLAGLGFAHYLGSHRHGA